MKQIKFDWLIYLVSYLRLEECVPVPGDVEDEVLEVEDQQRQRGSTNN